MTLTIAKRFRFEAHHRLPWHDGKCARDHGHSYLLEVAVRGPVRGDNGAPDSGMVIDFATLSEPVTQLVDELLDHHSLNAVHANPTAEHIVEWLVATLRPVLPGLCRVRLWETDTAYAEWSS